MKKSVVTLSGGLDSAVALGWAIENLHSVESAVFVDYGQHTRLNEYKAASQICSWYHVNLIPIKMMTPPSLLTTQLPTAELKPDVEKTDPEDVPPVYVPMRNLLIVAHVAAFVYPKGIRTIVTGSTPSTSYPDTGKHYWWEVEDILSRSSWSTWEILTPLIEMSKAEVIELGRDLGVPLELTWSCLLSESSRPCGKCRACRKRAEAYAELGELDPALEK